MYFAGFAFDWMMLSFNALQVTWAIKCNFVAIANITHTHTDTKTHSHINGVLSVAWAKDSTQLISFELISRCVFQLYKWQCVCVCVCYFCSECCLFVCSLRIHWKLNRWRKCACFCATKLTKIEISLSLGKHRRDYNKNTHRLWINKADLCECVCDGYWRSTIDIYRRNNRRHCQCKR